MLVNEFNNQCITNQLPVVHFLFDTFAELRARPHDCTQHVTYKTHQQQLINEQSASIKNIS